MTAQDFASDIPLSLALSAHNGTSFSPASRAASEREQYAAGLTADLAALSKDATTPEKAAQLAEEFARYRDGYKHRYQRYLASRSRVISWFIAGPANFPAERMNKRSEVSHKRLSELLEFRTRALEAIRRALHPEWRPIMAGDADALERLTVKLAKAEALQERMKMANKAIKQSAKAGRDEQMAALVGLGFSLDRASALLTPNCFGWTGFEPFRLTNNGAQIRTMRARLVQLEVAQATPTTEKTSAAGIRVEDDPPANRVRLFFPGKPDSTVRDHLKSSGFRWAPSIGAWQAYRNDRAVHTARSFLAA